MVDAGELSTSVVARAERLRTGATMALSVAAALAGGIAVAILTDTGRASALAVTAVVALPVFFWRWPATAPPLLAFFATAVARLGFQSNLDLLGRLPLWRSLNETSGLSGVYILPVELVMALAILTWVAREGAARRLKLPRTEVSAALGIVVLVAFFAELHGLIAGGDLRISLYELRPFLYLAAGYLIASWSVGSPLALRALLWAMVLGTGYMALIGTQLASQLAHTFPPPNQLLEHDESLFFSVYLLLMLSLYAFGQRGWLRRVATVLAPLVAYADLANNRRVAWLILPACLALLVLVVWLRNPPRRHLIGWLTVLGLLLAGAYVAVFHNSTGTIGFPAHAIWSNFQPDPRDASSNLYRALEDRNLAKDIKGAFVLGTGFGLPFAHSGLSFDASSFDPLVFYIPHNSVLWVWVKMGLAGMFAFWWTMGVAIVSAGRQARQADPMGALVATLAMAAVAGYLLLGWLDVGLAAVRIAVLVGLLLGAVEALPRLRSAAASSLVRLAAMNERDS